jgi:ABC-type nitrate/sulfonate/bicarbonate transport system substrate-binding protein
VDPSTVNLVVVGTDPSVLTSGSVDAYIGYGTEQGLDLQQAGYDVKIVYFDELGDPDYGNAYFAKTSYLEDNADLVAAWMRADVKGWQDFCAHPKAAAKMTWNLYHKQTQAVLSSEEASAQVSVPLINGGAAAEHGVLWVENTAFKLVYELYKTAGIITDAIDIEDVYTQKFLVEAGDKA